jgi:hypothetical protein
LLGEQLPERDAGFLLEQVFQARMAEIELTRQIFDSLQRLRLDHLQDFEHTSLLHQRLNVTGVNTVGPGLHSIA